MKLPGLNWEKMSAGGRILWSATTRATGLVRGKRALVTIATLGAGTMASSAGYFLWQGQRPTENPTVAQAGLPAGGDPDESGESGVQPIPIESPNADNDGPTSDASQDSTFAPLKPPPPSAFRGGTSDGSGFARRFRDDDNQSPAADGNDGGLGSPAADEAPPAEEGATEVAQDAAAGGDQVVESTDDAQGAIAANDPAAAAPGGGRPRALTIGAIGAGSIRRVGDETPSAGAAGNGERLAGEPASDAGEPARNETSNDTAAGAPVAEDSAPEATPTEPQPERPVPDRIVIPSDPPATLRPNNLNPVPGNGTSSGLPRDTRTGPPASRFQAGGPLAPVPETPGSYGAAGSAAGAASGAALGAAGAAGSAGIGAALDDAGPSIARATPGPKELEGAQTPSLTVEKLAPAEIQVGRPAVFEIKVRNVGRVTAHGVVVSDHVPVGTRLLDAQPEFGRGADGTIRWQLGALAPGQEATLAMKLLPEQEGEIGGVAQVSFQTQASARTVCTRPVITLQHQTQPKVLIGDDVVLSITIANTGTGAATDLVIEEAVPEGLSHPVDKDLEYQVGTLRPGESRRLDLTLKAARAGTVENVLVARSGEQVVAEDRLRLEVQAPQLKVGLTGPKVRYLDRQAVYNVSVANPGTAPARNIELAAYLPRGLKFVAAENQGQYDAKQHAVFWGLAELPVGATGAAQLTLLPIEPGQQALRVTGQGDLGVQDELQQAVVVETLSELQFSVADVADPIEVGSETTYDIRITNRGTRAATQVQVLIAIPPELQAIGGEGPSRVVVRGNEFQIDPLARLAPDTEARYKLQVRGLRPGDPRIRVQLVSAESPNPVSKEESTRVYADE